MEHPVHCVIEMDVERGGYIEQIVGFPHAPEPPFATVGSWPSV